MKIKYRCEGCNRDYDLQKEAQECEKNTETKRVVKVGDIVLARGDFEWFDGDIRWVSNPEVRTHPGSSPSPVTDPKKHAPRYNCFDDCCCFTFYYVVSFIDIENHRVRYHLTTNAMTGETGYKDGWTFNENHYLPRKVNVPPKFVIKDSKTLLGHRADFLL